MRKVNFQLRLYCESVVKLTENSETDSHTHSRGPLQFRKKRMVLSIVGAGPI